MKAILTHIDASHSPTMVDVSDKEITKRMALARARIRLPKAVQDVMHNGELVTAKGPVFHTAIIAGTQAVKKTADLIPFCHTLPIERCKIRLRHEGEYILIECEVATTAKTGVEMEALTGASVAALTVYDMTKALSHEMVIESIMLASKTGGKRTIKEA